MTTSKFRLFVLVCFMSISIAIASSSTSQAHISSSSKAHISSTMANVASTKSSTHSATTSMPEKSTFYQSTDDIKENFKDQVSIDYDPQQEDLATV